MMDLFSNGFRNQVIRPALALNVPCVYEDPEQNIWMGTYEGKEGTWKYDQTTGKFHNYLPGKTAKILYRSRRRFLGLYE